LADYGTVLARTNSEAPKHAGISMFIVDMRDPSVEIRPIHQIDGTSHFNEVFFNDTRVPNSRLLGVLNEGWSQTTAMLMYERVAIGSGETMGVSHPVAERLIETARLNGRIDQPVLRQNLMRLWTEETVKSLVSMRTQAEIKSGKPPGPGGSIGKLQGSRIHRLTRTVVSEVVGASVTAWEPESDLDQWSRGIVHSLGMSIGGGTDEIQRNVIGERVLGLPREPVVDRNVPFKDLMVGFAR
jgi:alkylation response protein AidB-like acyl-CoA dehydrogenase